MFLVAKCFAGSAIFFAYWELNVQTLSFKFVDVSHIELRNIHINNLSIENEHQMSSRGGSSGGRRKARERRGEMERDSEVRY